MEAKGSCLCKAVKFTFKLKHKHFDACHCGMCRSWGGGPGLTVESDGNVKIFGEENVTVYDSSAWAQRGFCNKCGSHLFFRLKDKPFCNFTLGSLENHQDFEFKVQIYVDDKPENYSFANQTKMMTEQDVLKAFGVIP
jgi:hypothetical protein